jgi:hypothetical protein
MKDNKGFDGLNDLGSDIEDILKKGTHKKEDKSSAEYSNQNQTNQPYPNNTNETESEIDKLEKKIKTNQSQNPSYTWLWWLVGLGILVFIVSQSGDNSSSNNSSSYQSSPSSTSSKTYSEPPKSVDDYFESKPESYTSILNKNQLLYCEAEKIRLDAVQYKIDKYSSYEVDKYNQLSNDYNSRCANKQYYKNDMYYVERNIKDKKYKLEQEGLARFGKSNSSYSGSSYTTPKITVPTYTLSIKATPSDARIRIMNITPKYYDGIKLEKGKYHIIVDKQGYETIDQWITLEKDEYFKAELNPKNISKEKISYTNKTPRMICEESGKNWKWNSLINKWECLTEKEIKDKKQFFYNFSEEEKKAFCIKNYHSWRYDSSGNVFCGEY